MRTPALVAVEEPAPRFEALFAAARRRGLRIGWLDLGTDATPPPELASAAAAGAFKAVAVGEGRALSLKPVRGVAVLRDLLREHFLGCAVVLLYGDDRFPRLRSGDGSYRLVFSPDRQRRLDADQTLAELVRPKHRVGPRR